MADRRRQVQATMGTAAGIVRSQDGLQQGLESMMHLCLEAQVRLPLGRHRSDPLAKRWPHPMQLEPAGFYGGLLHSLSCMHKQCLFLAV